MNKKHSKITSETGETHTFARCFVRSQMYKRFRVMLKGRNKVEVWGGKGTQLVCLHRRRHGPDQCTVPKVKQTDKTRLMNSYFDDHLHLC